MGFGSFNTARQTLKGYEIMNMIRKGQTSWSGERSRQRTGSLHAPNLWSSCIVNSRILGVFCSQTVFATQPNPKHLRALVCKLLLLYFINLKNAVSFHRACPIPPHQDDRYRAYSVCDGNTFTCSVVVAFGLPKPLPKMYLSYELAP